MNADRHPHDIFGLHRVRTAMTLGMLILPVEQFVVLCLELGLLEEILPKKYKIPAEVEAGRIEGWCCISKGAGALAIFVVPPLNLRQDDGKILGEAVLVENRGGDMWALCLFLRDDEELDSFAARVRVAMMMRNVVDPIDTDGAPTPARPRFELVATPADAEAPSA